MNQQPEPGYEEIDPQGARTAPAIRPPRWSGAKTAVTAALAISIASAGAIGAAAAVPQGTSAGDGPGMSRDGGHQPWSPGTGGDRSR